MRREIAAMALMTVAFVAVVGVCRPEPMKAPPVETYDAYEGLTVLLATGCGPYGETLIVFEEDEVGPGVTCKTIVPYWVEGQPREPVT